MQAKGAQLYVGPAGWSYDDWNGIVYPEKKPKGFRPPTFLAQWFNTIEINTTFYRPPPAGMVKRWVKDVEDVDDFLYTAKLWERFTHQREEHWIKDEVQVFRDGMAPLVEAGRLGALLLQFPWSFRYNAHSESWLSDLTDTFGDYPLVVEVRHTGWMQDHALQFLEGLGVGFCNIDQPPARNNIPLTSHAFGGLGYLRLHGRNADAWFDKEAGRDQRYDYTYSNEELDEIQRALEEIADRVERMFVIANNHYRGQAVATDLQIIRRLTGEEVGAPGIISELYDMS
jgi:uncharacterized protein YecE (DUF72 family)